MRASLRLPLTRIERRDIRRAGFRVAELASLKPAVLEMATEGSIDFKRAEQLTGLASLQSLPNVGIENASHLFQSGILSRDHLQGMAGDELYALLDEKLGLNDPHWWDLANAICHSVNEEFPEKQQQGIPWWGRYRKALGFDPRTLLESNTNRG